MMFCLGRTPAKKVKIVAPSSFHPCHAMLPLLVPAMLLFLSFCNIDTHGLSVCKGASKEGSLRSM